MAKISILSPAYNHGKYVGDTIKSVLNQTFTDFEYIISDDASTDDTLSQLKRFDDRRIRIIANDKNCGVSVNSRRCLKHATGEYIMCLATDDTLEADALQILSDALDANPACLSVFARSRFVDERGQFTGEEFTSDGVGLNRFQLLNSIFNQNHVFCASTQMTRRQALEQSGFYQENLLQTQDIDFWAKLLFMGEVIVLPNHLLRYRLRDGNLNLSGANPRADLRFSFEMSEVLELYLQQITTFEFLGKTFPEVLANGWPQEDRFVSFYLAKLAMTVADFPYYRLFGLRVLHRLLSSPEIAKELQDKFDFGYREFFELTGTTNIFFQPLVARKKERLQNVVNQQIEQLKKMYDLIDGAGRLRGELESTIAAQNRQIMELSAQNIKLSEYCGSLEASCHQYAGSLSWRVTAPLRQIKTTWRR